MNGLNAYDTGRTRFVTRSVAYIDDLERLAQYIPVRDWFPIDAKIQVGNVIDLVHKLGGQKLYGDDPSAALREIISNASDAVRARRTLASPQELTELRLRVAVQIRSEGDEQWLIVRDNGIGMARVVMSGPLLDFGNSYWRSEFAREDFPGLISSGFSPTGEFGIGFFSVFMLGDKVRVTSRRFDLGSSDTHVLVFNYGLGSRPLLRRAVTQEFLPYGGTEVAVALRPEVAKELLNNGDLSLKDVCSQLCPTSDVNIDIISDDGQVSSAVEANDWSTCSPSILVSRLGRIRQGFDRSVFDRIRPLGRPYEPIKGRAAIQVESVDRRYVGGLSTITIGGMRSYSYMSHIVGVFLGETLSAARSAATPIADKDEIANWATEQATLAVSQEWPPDVQMEFASVVCTLNGQPGDLVVAHDRRGYMNLSQIRDWAVDKERILMWGDNSFQLSELPLEALDANVLLSESGWPGIFQQNYPHGRRFPRTYVLEDRELEVGLSLDQRCAEAIAESWGLPRHEGLRQYDARVRVVQEFENKFMDADEDIPDGSDRRYPFREKVATLENGEWVIDPVTPLVRPVGDARVVV